MFCIYLFFKLKKLGGKFSHPRNNPKNVIWDYYFLAYTSNGITFKWLEHYKRIIFI